MNGTCAVRGLMVTADGSGQASHAGSLLLAEMADRSGLTAGLSVTVQVVVAVGMVQGWPLNSWVSRSSGLRPCLRPVSM